MSYKAPPGVFDILPLDDEEPWKSSYLWNYVESVIRKTARDYGFKEIRTPLFEKTELFQRSVGEGTDIVSKEMYTFTDKGGRSLTLRPEGTAPAMRAFIEHRLDTHAPQHKFFYIAPMFRYERAQAGRFRQHHQFGVEAIGNASPEQDVEIIDLIYTLYKRLGLTNLLVRLNSLGDPESRKKFKEQLVDYLSSKKEFLSEDSKRRLETNPLRILDSKAEEDREIIKNAPSILDSISEKAKIHFERVKSLLETLSIPYEVTPTLVRGLDYYNYTVFEIVSNELGSQNSLVGGGRYDGLIKQLGGVDLPAFGFGTGIERIIQTMLKQMTLLPTNPAPTLFVIPLGDEAAKKAFTLVHDLRSKGIFVSLDYSKRKLQKVMQEANDARAKYVAVIGENELKNEELSLKDMETGESFPIPFSSLERILSIEEKKDNLALSYSELFKPFRNDQEVDFFIKHISQAISKTKELSGQLQNAVSFISELIKQKKE